MKSEEWLFAGGLADGRKEGGGVRMQNAKCRMQNEGSRRGGLTAGVDWVGLVQAVSARLS